MGLSPRVDDAGGAVIGNGDVQGADASRLPLHARKCSELRYSAFSSRNAIGVHPEQLVKCSSSLPVVSPAEGKAARMLRLTA